MSQWTSTCIPVSELNASQFPNYKFTKILAQGNIFISYLLHNLLKTTYSAQKSEMTPQVTITEMDLYFFQNYNL